MAAGGGGAWKVAYADFVTAMMAFFLVMWIVGQDQKVRKSVADYFSDPMGMPDDGTGKKPVRLGGPFDGINNGRIPDQEGVQKQHGSNVFGKTHEFSPNTKVVYDWIMEDQKAHSRWQKEASEQRELARWSTDVQKGGKTIEQVAGRRLANQLREDTLRDVPKGMNEIHRNLLLRAITQDVNWEQIAKVLIQSDRP